MSDENGCNIGNVPDCHECEALEREVERMRPELDALRLQVKMMYTLDEIEAWVKSQVRRPNPRVENWPSLRWAVENLRDPKTGLAASVKGGEE